MDSAPLVASGASVDVAARGDPTLASSSSLFRLPWNLHHNQQHQHRVPLSFRHNDPVRDVDHNLVSSQSKLQEPVVNHSLDLFGCTWLQITAYAYVQLPSGGPLVIDIFIYTHA